MMEKQCNIPNGSFLLEPEGSFDSTKKSFHKGQDDGKGRNIPNGSFFESEASFAYHLTGTNTFRIDGPKKDRLKCEKRSSIAASNGT
jgi:hypothetical protein